jgi:prolipoprotein diacylglyceryltransferase
MFSNEFWYGFLLGVGLVFLVFLVTRLLAKARSKNRNDS